MEKEELSVLESKGLMAFKMNACFLNIRNKGVS